MKRPPIPTSYLVAGGIAAAATLWLVGGSLLNAAGERETPPPIGERAQAETERPSVRTRLVVAENHEARITLRGRTQAEKRVEVRAEVAGAVAYIRADKGSEVREGDVICELDVGAREAQLDQAKARLRQAEIELSAARELARKGHRSETQVAAAQAAYESAAAEVKAMTKQLDDTRIVAPFDGVVDDRMVNVGDFMQVGQSCALVLDEDPFLVIGAASEREVGLIRAGMPAEARLATGETAAGRIRFVAKSADPKTRTFLVEFETPNPGRTLRDGLTADIRVAIAAVPAHPVPPSILTLSDDGAVGVKIVEDGKARFMPVTVIDETREAVWVTGLPATANVILVGQDFVVDGQDVNAISADPPVADAARSGA
ncbi:MAG: efflux RND transporter periplasmic adaptor subunit [Alphaproteobacteria bacterium]|nr:efflux RND transporter periplasmic adaptor subunit [Alphaproteobacteria bacterium]